MKYSPIEWRSKQDVEAAVSKNEPEDLAGAVISAALYSDDPDWALSICLKLSSHEHSNVRGNAILGFGHIARIHGVLNEGTVKRVIEEGLRDRSDYVRAQANSAADDVEFFLNWVVNRGG